MEFDVCLFSCCSPASNPMPLGKLSSFVEMHLPAPFDHTNINWVSTGCILQPITRGACVQVDVLSKALGYCVCKAQ